ncbi:RhuM family protein [Cupriavidus taiwanensis]|uniref:RhuM family protein n=1 Tax=Cupriavidus taiwanensis TaxID=164546 RepID=UPI0039C1C18F
MPRIICSSRRSTAQPHCGDVSRLRQKHGPASQDDDDAGFWADKLDAFLAFNEREVLTHAGKISAEVAERLALERYTEFETKRRDAERLAADAEDVAALERIEQQLDGTVVKKP